MTFRTICCTGLPASQSPFRVVDEQQRELEWVNRFLDIQCVRGLAPLSLRVYANCLLHFVRWWASGPGIDVTRFTADQFTEATLIDYVRFQGETQPGIAPETINSRSSMLRRLFRFYFHGEMPLAMVALMLLNGLRSREVLALQLEDLLFSEAQIRVHGSQPSTCGSRRS